MLTKIRRLSIYVVALTGIAVIILALARTDFKYDREESVVHIAIWLGLVSLVLHADIRNEGKASELSMLVWLGILVIVLSEPASGIFSAGILAHAPAAILFILSGAIAMLIGKTELLRGCLAAAFMICLYSMGEFPAYRDIDTDMEQMAFVSEMLMMIAAWLHSFRISGSRFADSVPASAVLKVLYPEERKVIEKSLKQRNIVQLAAITGACMILECAEFIYESEVPWLYLILFLTGSAAAAWQSSSCGYRYDNMLLAFAVVCKIIADLSWDLAPAERNYAGLYVLMETVMLAAALGNCRKLFGIAAVSEMVLIIAAITEYYCDPTVFIFIEGQLILISKGMLTAGLVLFAAGPWSGAGSVTEGQI